MIWLNVLHINLMWSIVVLAAASLEYLMPELSRTGVAFSVTVAPEFKRAPDHARIVRHYRRGVMLSAFAGLAIATGSVGPLDGWNGPAAFCAQYCIFTTSFLIARMVTMRYRVEPATVREAELVRREPPTMLALLVLAPLFLIGGALLRTYTNWQQIPDPYPVHWGLDGQPDLWVERTPLHVYGILGLLAGITGILAFFCYGFLFWVRRSEMVRQKIWYSFPFVWIAVFLGT